MPTHAAPVRTLLEWFAAHARDLPWRRTRDPWAVLVSEVMLQQTQVKTVIPYWECWMRRFPDAASLATAGEAEVLKLWEGLGYYRRARNLQAAACALVTEHGGRFPRNLDAILALPGVGRYTAGAVASIAFNQPAPILDGNVMRVLARLFAVDGDPAAREVNARLWRLAGELVVTAARIERPRERACSALNQALMELGATVCTPRTPACPTCPVRRHCAAHRTGRVAELPAPRARPATSARRFLVIAAEHAERWLVRRRPAAEVNGGFWEFPNVEVLSDGDADPAAAASRLLGVRHAAPERLGEVRHAITRYRVTQEAWRVRLPRAVKPRDGGAWHTLAELHALPMVTAHRRLLKRLEAA